MNQGPKIGTIDIETAPLKASVWGLFDQTVGLNQIATGWTILSFCFKPLGCTRKHIVYMDTSDRDDPRDDSLLMAKLWEILHEYDFLIAHNGKRFDLRKIKARLILLGFPPPSPVKVLDTLLMARQVADFTSNKLEWLSQYLSTIQKSKHKEFPGFELWAECLKGNPRAWAAMKRYNVPDVLSCEEIYLKLRPWVTNHPNVVVYSDDETVRCPVCGSSNIEQDGFSYTNIGQYHRYHCLSKTCGAWSRDRYTVNSKAKRRSLLANN